MCKAEVQDEFNQYKRINNTTQSMTSKEVACLFQQWIYVVVTAVVKKELEKQFKERT